MKRRNLLKGLSILPFAGTIIPEANAAEKISASPLAGPGAKENVFRSIGVEPIINCRGTFTIIGGSLEREEVRAAMEAASKDFVQYDELADGVGKRLAELTGAEWGMVSSGCAAAMKHVTAACVTGGNPEKLIRIPDLSGFDKTEVVIPKTSRNAYDHAIRNIGVKIIEVENVDQLRSALSPRTAMIYIMAAKDSQPGQPLSTEVIAQIAKPLNIPVLVDAAAEVLTIPNIHLTAGRNSGGIQRRQSNMRPSMCGFIAWQ